jgi:hypothetical protein
MHPFYSLCKQTELKKLDSTDYLIHSQQLRVETQILFFFRFHIDRLYLTGIPVNVARETKQTLREI